MTKLKFLSTDDDINNNNDAGAMTIVLRTFRHGELIKLVYIFHSSVWLYIPMLLQKVPLTRDNFYYIIVNILKLPLSST